MRPSDRARVRQREQVRGAAGRRAGPGGGAGLSAFPPPWRTLTDRSGGGHMWRCPAGGWSVLAPGLVLSVPQSPFPFQRSTLPVGRKDRISVNTVAPNHPDAWLLKYQTSAGKWDVSCSTGRHKSPKVGGVQPCQLLEPDSAAGAFPYPGALLTASQRLGENCFYRKSFGEFVSSLSWLRAQIPVFLWLSSLCYKAWCCLLCETH